MSSSDLCLDNPLSVPFFCLVRDQVSHPYKLTGKIRVVCVCVLIFIFFNSKREHKWFWAEFLPAVPELNHLFNI
jgi:hypothetical protein